MIDGITEAKIRAAIELLDSVLPPENWYPWEPCDYEVECARCGKEGTTATFMLEEGDEWECPDCYDRCEAQEYYVRSDFKVDILVANGTIWTSASYPSWTEHGRMTTNYGGDFSYYSYGGTI